MIVKIVKMLFIQKSKKSAFAHVNIKFWLLERQVSPVYPESSPGTKSIFGFVSCFEYTFIKDFCLKKNASFFPTVLCSELSG